MNYFITTVVIIVFFYIVLKKNLPPLLRKLGIIRRTVRGRNKDPDTSPDQPPAGSLPDGAYRPEAAGTVSTGNTPDSPKHTCFEVLAFSVLEAENSVSFRERVSLHLNRAVMELEQKGYPTDIDYLTVAEVLVVILRYRI